MDDWTEHCEYCKEEITEPTYYSIDIHCYGIGRSKFFHQLCFEIMAGPQFMFDPREMKDYVRELEDETP